MNQLLLTQSPAMRGAIYMVLAGIAFAVVNISIQMVTMQMGMSSTAAAFWQYFIAISFSVPVVARYGLKSLKTDFPVLHILRVFFSVVGIQLWVAGLAHVPIWQAIALVMTSPFFVTLGAVVFLGEKPGISRWLATLVGFIGGLVILEPWADGFSTYAFLPVAAAALWAGTSVLTKKLTRTEIAESVTVYLVALLLPVNALFAGFGGGFAVPGMEALALIVVAGLLTALALFLSARAYEVADASFVQPFDHLKLPLNVLAGFLVFGYAPTGNLWIGAALIIGASFYVIRSEQNNNTAKS